MLKFRDISIKWKLRFIIILTCGIALLSACITFITYDQITLKTAMIRDLNVLAEMIGENCSAALIFNNEVDAKMALSALKVNQHIVAACIYKSDGGVLAGYLRNDVNNEFSLPAVEKNRHRFKQKHLILFREIILNNEKIGTIYIQADLRQLNSRKNQLILTAFIFLVISIAVIFLISLRVQKLISDPILHLARVAKDVSLTEDYSVRARRIGQDELGFLTLRFNEMLTLIQERDVALQKAHAELKERAKELLKELTERKSAEKRLKLSLKEKEVLLKEVHHRVKNNLQIISSLIYLQSKNIQDKAASQMFRESQNRVKSMALIHEKLYKSKDLAKIDFPEYIRSLVNHLLQSYRMNSQQVKIITDIDDISLNIDAAIQCGMIINELVSNCLKHAFKKDNSGEICIKLHFNREKQFILIVSDNGIGIPENLDFKKTSSLGLQLVCNLTEQLDGTIELDRSAGTAFKIIFRN